MAMPTPEQIHDLYVEGKWNDMMLRAALVGHVITQEQYDQAIADRKAKEDGTTTKKSTKKSSKK